MKQKLKIKSNTLLKQVENNYKLSQKEQVFIISDSLMNNKNVAYIEKYYSSKTLNGYTFLIKGIPTIIFTTQDYKYYNNEKLIYNDIQAFIIYNDKEKTCPFFLNEKFSNRINDLWNNGYNGYINSNDDILYSYHVLYKILLKNNKVYTSLNYVSQNGMSRHISVYAIIDNQPININWHYVKLNLENWNRQKNALQVGGCGMDMCWNTVYILSCKLFNNIHFTDIENKSYSNNQGGYFLKQDNL